MWLHCLWLYRMLLYWFWLYWNFTVLALTILSMTILDVTSLYDYFRCYCIGFDYFGILLCWLWLYCLWLYWIWLHYMTFVDVTVLALTKLSVNTLVATYKHSCFYWVCLTLIDFDYIWCASMGCNYIRHIPTMILTVEFMLCLNWVWLID